MKFHPDKNLQDDTTEQFKTFVNAFEVLAAENEKCSSRKKEKSKNNFYARHTHFFNQQRSAQKALWTTYRAPLEYGNWFINYAAYDKTFLNIFHRTTSDTAAIFAFANLDNDKKSVSYWPLDQDAPVTLKLFKENEMDQLLAAFITHGVPDQLIGFVVDYIKTSPEPSQDVNTQRVE